MDTPLSDPQTAEELMKHARALYHSLAEELTKSLKATAAGEPDPTSKGVAETIRAHRKALQAILDIEMDFVRCKQEKGAVDAIDVEAARREIHRRFDRLSAIRGEA